LKWSCVKHVCPSCWVYFPVACLSVLLSLHLWHMALLLLFALSRILTLLVVICLVLKSVSVSFSPAGLCPVLLGCALSCWAVPCPAGLCPVLLGCPLSCWAVPCPAGLSPVLLPLLLLISLLVRVDSLLNLRML